MKKESNSGISFFQRYLTVWVIVCMLIGIMLGHFLPGMKEALNHLEYAGISIPLAVLIWIMIYPMVMKVDFNGSHRILRRSISQEPCFSEQLHVPLWYLSGVR